MSDKEYNKFREGLKDNIKEYLDELYNNYYIENENNIGEGINLDRKHLSLVNYCSNFFQYGSEIQTQFGYRLLKIEPLYELNIKNFDLAIYNLEKGNLILVECKHSMSRMVKEINETVKAIKETEKNLDKIKDMIGGDINNIEYVICTDGNIGIDLIEKIRELDAPIITWVCSEARRELKLVRSRLEEYIDSLKNRRVHQDADLNTFLFEGVISRYGSTRLFKILPSSNMGVIIVEINLRLKQLIGRGDVDSSQIDFVYLHHIIEQELHYSNYDDDKISELTENIIKKAIEKDLWKEKLKDSNIRKNKFEVINSSSSANRLKNRTEKNYIELNAKHRAQEKAVEELRKSGKISSLDPFLNKN